MREEVRGEEMGDRRSPLRYGIVWSVGGLEPGAASFVAAGDVEGGAGYPSGGGADEV